ncbi:MAG TPA: twin-arginine translocase TatA/TatE family subunit [Acidimicrobiales bacterium]
MLAELFSEGGLIAIAIIALIIGGAKLPQLARNLGSAKKEFEKGLKDGDDGEAAKSEKKADPKALEPGSDSTITQQTKGETTA